MSIALDMDTAKHRKPATHCLGAGSSSGSSASCSVIVPAYRENLNLGPLVTRLFSALASHPSASTEFGHVEVIIVDDNSRDGSVQTVSSLQSQGYNVRIIVRTTERGLSSAVVRGFREAQGQRMICMDADLQHPPESVPTLLLALTDRQPFVLATRYGPGVSMDKDWPLHRQIISAGARWLARPLTSASDPMSGFFGITKSTFTQIDPYINPHGFKIALDLLVKSNLPNNALAQIPFSFGLRQQGESKLDTKVMLKYLQQLAQLYRYKFGSIPLLAVFVLLLFLAFYLWSYLLAPLLFG